MIPTLSCDAVLVLVGPDGRTRRYPVPAGTPLCDVYVIDGVSWSVVAVLHATDAPAPPAPNDAACGVGG